MNNQQLPRNKELKLHSTKLRNNATRQENHLWYDYLRAYPMQFNRQRIIGEYIVDFYCAKARLVIEIDGSHHYEENAMEKDRVRTQYFEGLGLKVLRFANLEIDINFDGVCQAIDKAIKNSMDNPPSGCACHLL